VHLRAVGEVPAPAAVEYDTLIVAGGSAYSYFGHDEWSEYAGEVKSLESALTVRSRILSAFEAAEAETDPDQRAAWLTFAVVGAGPTGVEMAGQIGELARDTLRRDYDAADPRKGRILLIEAADRVLTSFPPSLSAKAQRSLEKLGVTPMLGATVVGVDDESVSIDEGGGSHRRIPTRTIVWAAGVTASKLGARLAELTGAEVDRAGRIAVEPDLTLPAHPEVFALGDMIRVRGVDGSPPVTYPGVAPVAMQQGRYAGRLVAERLRARTLGSPARAEPPSPRRPEPPFHYEDKGQLATIGRARAVADVYGLRLWGLPAWLIWLVVHLFYLVGFENRVLIVLRWTYSFLTRGRGTRLITEAAGVPYETDGQEEQAGAAERLQGHA
jgi:NADH:quinone reductase (non-electrogenic)